MTIFKRGNVYYVESKDAGRARVCVSTGTRTLKEARRFAAGLDLATRCPSYDLAVEFLRRYYQTDEGRTPLAEAWQRYEDVARSVGRDAVAKSTWRLRREHVERFVRWCGKAHQKIRHVEEVDGRVAAEFAAALAEEGRKGKTRKGILSNLSTVWLMLSKVSPNLQNPWRGLSPKTDDSVRGEPFTDAQADAIVEAAGNVGKGWRLACLIARYTGLRYGDVAMLTWNEVDLAGGVLRRMPNKTVRFEIGLVNYLHPTLLAVLTAAKAVADAAPEGSAAREFVNPQHAAVYGDSKRWKAGIDFSEVLKAAGIEGRYTFHSWRHYFRTKLAAAHVSNEVAMMLCGHTNAKTSRRYDHDDHADELKAAILAAFNA